ncbi:MAG: hypothetical protein GY810_06070 [Aureispira sp.]|nr:hypothetical protein [Aureispira sp.]
MKWNNWFWTFFIVYIISLFLPSYKIAVAIDQTVVFYGYTLFIELIDSYSYTTIFETFITISTNIPNIIVLFLLIMRWRLYNNNLIPSNKTVFQNKLVLFLTIITASSFWFFWWFEQVPTLPIWGYYIWVLATSGMTVIHYLDCNQRLNQLQDNNSLKKHLIE